MRIPKNEYDAIMFGLLCPYCKNYTELLDSQVVYQVSYGPMFICQPCKAWVGTHKMGDISLGRLANKELRSAKINAHNHFDKLWKGIKEHHHKERQEKRTTEYKWLSQEMKTESEYTHIGMFDVEQCKKVVALCIPRLRETVDK